MLKQAHLIIHGKVQGVFYRDYTRKKARELNLTGWVRNNPDGTVEVLCYGKPENIDEFIKWCHQGSPLSNVAYIDIQKQPFEGEGPYESFEIEY